MARTNIIEYITISSAVDAADFWDLSAVKEMTSSSSDSHGGLQA